jgi:hypothetical protein
MWWARCDMISPRTSDGHSLIPPWCHPPESAKRMRVRSVGRSRGFAARGDVACAREAENWSETFLSAIVSMATNSKDNLSKDSAKCDVMTEISWP